MWERFSSATGVFEFAALYGRGNKPLPRMTLTYAHKPGAHCGILAGCQDCLSVHLGSHICAKEVNIITVEARL